MWLTFSTPVPLLTLSLSPFFACCLFVKFSSLTCVCISMFVCAVCPEGFAHGRESDELFVEIFLGFCCLPKGVI